MFGFEELFVKNTISRGIKDYNVESELDDLHVKYCNLFKSNMFDIQNLFKSYDLM